MAKAAWSGSKINPLGAVHNFKPPALPEVADSRHVGMRFQHLGNWLRRLRMECRHGGIWCRHLRTTAVQFKQGDVDKIGKMVDLIRSQNVIAGVAGHGLDAMRACVKANLKVDFYQKTLHTHDYHTAPKAGETGDLGRYDNSWCKDPEEVVDFFFGVKQPFIAFKVMAAGAIPPKKVFPYSFDNGADFVLAGMFDWQVLEGIRIAKEVLGNVKRTRPWCG